jgi:probable HAF family extracellular repeat protein
MRLFAALLCGVSLAAAPSYQILDISGGGTGTTGVRVNASGQVALQGNWGGGNQVGRFDGTSTTPLSLLSGYPSSSPVAINSTGQIAGDSFSTFPTQSRAVIWTGTSVSDLGVAGPGVGNTYAKDLNDAGQVAGEYSLFDGTTFLGNRAFRYSGGAMQDLGTLGTTASGFGAAAATAINSNGFVVGSSILYESSQDKGARAFLHNGTSMTNLGTLGTSSAGSGYSVSVAINQSADVAGTSRLYSGGQDQGVRAFLYRGGQMESLGTLGTFSGGFGGSSAEDMNDSGFVVGSSIFVENGANKGDRAFLWNGTSMVNLGALGAASSGFSNSRATRINNAGQVIGSSARYDSSGNFLGSGGFLYSGGVMYDLLSLVPANSGWTNLFANDLNDAGMISGFGLINGERRAFLMKVSAVPEPGFYALLSFGLAGLFAARARRKS